MRKAIFTSLALVFFIAAGFAGNTTATDIVTRHLSYTDGPVFPPPPPKP